METRGDDPRLLAFYLPQYHPIPENDAWWGTGFTEWTNVTRARPLFWGHDQPRLPADLGYYDLRVPEIREAQASLARDAGIEGFVYYHYWFGGKRLLERPFMEVVKSGRPDFPFCVCWANQTWSGVWHGAEHRVLMEQTYPGELDNERHFAALLGAFHDRRYVRVDGKPVFVVYRPAELPDPERFTRQWRALAHRNGLPGIHFVAHLFSLERDWDYRAHGFDAAVLVSYLKAWRVRAAEMLRRRLQESSHGVGRDLGAWMSFVRNRMDRAFRRVHGGFRNIVRYEDALPFLLEERSLLPTEYPCAIPNWDNTPRAGRRGLVLHDSTPELFRTHLRRALSQVSNRPLEHHLVFIKSWNEWAEGNHLEPDQKFGHAYLRVVREERSRCATTPVASSLRVSSC
jgi:hypothetical protein